MVRNLVYGGTKAVILNFAKSVITPTMMGLSGTSKIYDIIIPRFQG
jgi:hypothetical protein